MATNQTMDEGNLTNVSVDDGTMPMDVDVGHQPHVHDYWTGKERVTLLDADVDVDAQDAFRFTFFDIFMGTPGVGGTFVELPDGAIVYEGTGKLEFTVSWTDATVTGAALRHRAANSRDFSEPQALTNGEALVIDVTPEMTDMPHVQTSRWGFLLHPAQAGQSIVGKIHVKIDIVRLGDIMLFPGHPELFNGADTLTLFSGQGESSQSNFITGATAFATGGGFEDGGLPSQRIVPMETLTMTANLTITDVTSSQGEATDLFFLYKPADTGRYYRANLVSGDMATGVFQFAWPVEMPQSDSPYAAPDASQWRFDVRVATKAPVGDDACSRCADVKVTYDLEVVAYKTRLDIAGEDPAAQNENDG